MGQLRNAIRAYLLEDISPGQVLRRLNRYAGSLGEGAFATTVIATLDASRTSWRFAGAGHPPPLVVAGGQARYLELGGPPIGAVDEFHYEAAEEALELPATVILYSDGLVERRGSTLEDGLARLRGLVEDAAREAWPSAALVDVMLEGEGPADDVALLVVDALAPGPFSIELDSDPSQLAVLRRKLRPWLRAHGLDEQDAHDVLVAVDEASSNAIEHPRDPHRPVFRVEARVEGDELVFRVSDSGLWREAVENASRGRGLAFMRSLMARVEILENRTGTEVVLRRALPARVSSDA